MKKMLLLILYLIFHFDAMTQSKGEFSNGLAWIKKNGKYGFINTKGILVIPILYDSVFSFSEDVAAVKKNKKWFYINLKGKPIHTLETERQIRTFSMARPYHYGLAVVCADWDPENSSPGMTVIDKSGYSAWVDFMVDSLGDFDKGYAVRKDGNTYNFLDHCQRLLLNQDYEKVDSFSKGYAKVWHQNTWRILDPYGQCISNCDGFPTLPFQDADEPSTLYFSCSGYSLSDLSIKKLDALAAEMNKNPSTRLVITGNGNSSYAAMQDSWAYAHATWQYLTEVKKINPERFFMQIGANGQQRSVNIRPANTGEELPNNIPPPFPNFKDCSAE